MVNQQGPAADVDGLAVHAAHNARAVFIGEVLHLGQGVLVFADDLVEHPGEGATHLLHQGGGGHDSLFRQGPAAKGLNAAQHHGAPGEQLAGVHQHGVDVAHLLHALIAHHHGAGPAGGAAQAADGQVHREHVGNRHAGAAGRGKGADGRGHAAGNQQGGDAQQQRGDEPNGRHQLGGGLRGVGLVREL